MTPLTQALRSLLGFEDENMSCKDWLNLSEAEHAARKERLEIALRLSPYHEAMLAVVEAADKCVSDVSMLGLKPEIMNLKINLILNTALSGLRELIERGKVGG